MRILVTTQGTKFIDDLETISFNPHSIHCQSHSTINIRTNRGPSQKKSRPSGIRAKFAKTIHTIDSFTKSKHKRLNSVGNIHNKKIIEHDNLNTKPSQYTTKNITIRKLRISLPKTFVEKYEKDTVDKQQIITTTRNVFPYLNSNQHTLFTNKTNGISTINKHKMLSFKEIIPTDTITKLKKHIIRNNEQKEKNRRITENNFRTEYHVQTDLEKFDNILETPKIIPTKLSLIKYLNEHKNLNPTTIKTLYKSSPERINRVNQMCQILLQEIDNNKLLNEFIQTKIKDKENNTKMTFKHKMEIMKDEVNRIKLHLGKYNIKLNEKDKFKDIHNEFVKQHWNKYNIERFNKKKKRKTLSLDCKNSEENKNIL